MSFRPVIAAVLFAACARGAAPSEDIPADARVSPSIDAKVGDPDAADIDAAPGTPDAKPGAPDAKPTPDGAPDANVDAMPSPDATPIVVNGLLLSEVVLAPTGGEFIEIVNPTASAVMLDHYYLSDNGTYWKLPAGGQTLETGDFIAQFPAGASIPSHGVITVALDTAANFTVAYPGVAPTYSVAGGTMTTVDVAGAAGLTNGGEPIILFSWDGQSDLVVDVDIMIAGVPSTTNLLGSKSNQTQDGPDTGTSTSKYAVDANTIAAQPAAPGSAKSTKRILVDTGHQIATGGNGVDGVDCTSEDTAVTWDSSAYTAPTPGDVPAALIP
ncbi:MAG: lamin tail domain-containing protein [Deltaproteobacteria bacterium]|nr:lamin tail domain-containing protein [Deltaproteobacteria bacterium]